VRLGYKPWKNSRDGVSLWELHQACTRMLRADYCGDGTPHTRDGTRVEVYDTMGIQSPEPDSGLSFEAGWRADGAVCVRKVRIAEITSLESAGAGVPGAAARARRGGVQRGARSPARGVGNKSILARPRYGNARIRSFAHDCLFKGFADEARVGNAAGLGTGLHSIEQRFRHAHVDLCGLSLQFKPHRPRAGKIVFCEVSSINEALCFLVGLKSRDFLSYNAQSHLYACTGR
jgi:hypothetical protein